MKKSLSIVLASSLFAALPVQADEGGYAIIMDLRRDAQQQLEQRKDVRDSAVGSLKSIRTTPLVAGRDSSHPALRVLTLERDASSSTQPEPISPELREQVDALEAALASLKRIEARQAPLSAAEQERLRPLRILLAQDLEEDEDTDEDQDADGLSNDTGRHELGRASPRNGTAELRHNAAGHRIVSHGMDYLGVRYRYGGTSRSTGVDCSGLVLNVYQHTLGLQMPRTAAEQARMGVRVSRDQLKPGDLVFFNTSRRANSHVGIYIGNNRMLHAPRSGGVVRIEDISKKYWASRYNGARRLILASAQ